MRIVRVIASHTASAPCAASAGPFFTRASWPWSIMRGRCSSRVKRVIRSTKVPIAELPRPRMRSPSQWPGTARSAASAGRRLIMISGEMKVLPRPRVRALGVRSTRPVRSACSSRRNAADFDELRVTDGSVADAHGLTAGSLTGERPAICSARQACAAAPLLPRSCRRLSAYSRAAPRSSTRSDDDACQSFLHIGSQCRIERKLACFGRRADRSACHCAVVARYSGCRFESQRRAATPRRRWCCSFSCAQPPAWSRRARESAIRPASQ